MFAVQVAVMKGRGGVLTSLSHYARMWDSVGVPSVCLYRGPATEPLRAAGVGVIDAPRSLTSPLFALTPALGRLRREIRAAGHGADPDCVMVHSDRALHAVRRMFPAAIIMTRCHSDKTKNKRNADIVVTLNPDQHERVTRELAGSRARTFMLGHPFMMDPTPALVTGEGSARINFVARFVADKDPLTFAHAVAQLRTRPLPPVRLIGDGPLQEDAKLALQAAGVEGEFLGWRSRPFEDFTRSDILVLPSRWEGLPWLLLEAQARGVPTIASDVSGNRLALGDGAYGDIFPVGNPEALAGCLDSALPNLGALRAKAERGRADLPDRFGPRAFWNRLQEAMRTVRSEAGMSHILDA
jgi:glycosyltransferase involved in cell wall biosynthesis